MLSSKFFCRPKVFRQLNIPRPFQNPTSQCSFNRTHTQQWQMSCLRRTFAGQPKISKKVSQAPKAQTYEISKDYSKLIFDDSGRALIFSHLNGERHLGWTMRLAVMVGCLSMWLLMMEIKDPLFGFGSKIGFGMLTFISMGLLTAANIYGRKIISKIW